MGRLGGKWLDWAPTTGKRREWFNWLVSSKIGRGGGVVRLVAGAGRVPEWLDWRGAVPQS